MVSALEKPVETQAQTGKSWSRAALLLVPAITYLVLSLSLAHTKAPWCDEGWFANPAYNLAFRGNLGSNVLEPSGFFLNGYLQGVQQRTYYITPTHLIALAGWFRVFPMNAFSARAYSICWGALTLPVLFYILRRLFPDRRVAALGTLFTAIDFIFLWSTADARMEAAANALALCSFAAYLYFRERDFQNAVLSSQALGACAVFTHPNAALVILAVAILAVRYDRDRLRARGWRYLAVAAAPYTFLAAAWSVYILQSPRDFMAQFFANAAGRDSERLRVLLRPDAAIWNEIQRHWAAYCHGGLWGGVAKGWMGLVLFLYLPAMIWFLWTRRQHSTPVRMFLDYSVAMLIGMTFLNGFKGYFYLIYLVPIYNAVFAAWLLHVGTRTFDRKCLAGAIGALFAILQLSASVVQIRQDEYHRDYEPAIRELTRDRAQGKSIVGTAALGFGLGFNGFKDDVRLGMYSGLSPDILVMDRAYRLYMSFYKDDEPAVFDHMARTLSTKYRLAAQHGSFWIFERARPDAAEKAWIDPGNHRD